MASYEYDSQNQELHRISGGTLYADMPIGSEIEYAGTTAPTGFLKCDGSTYSQVTYPELYAILGTTTLPNKSGYIIKAKQIGVPADFVDAIEDVMQFSTSSQGFNSSYGSGVCISQRYGKLAIITIKCVSITAQIAGGVIFATVPQGFRPKQTSKAVIAVVKPTASTLSSENAIQIDTSGNVSQTITDFPVGTEFEILFIYEAS